MIIYYKGQSILFGFYYNRKDIKKYFIFIKKKLNYSLLLWIQIFTIYHIHFLIFS